MLLCFQYNDASAAVAAAAGYPPGSLSVNDLFAGGTTGATAGVPVPGSADAQTLWHPAQTALAISQGYGAPTATIPNHMFTGHMAGMDDQLKRDGDLIRS